MKHIQSFNNFVAINEASWFPEDTIDNYINDGSSEWNKFWKQAKKGDTFLTNPSGVDVLMCKKSDMNKSPIPVESVWVGANYGASTGVQGATLATIIDRKKVLIDSSDEGVSEEPLDTIFYTLKGDNNNVYLLQEM